MDFQARIDQDLKEAMKARQADRLAVLRMLKSALLLAATEPGRGDGPLDEAAGLAIVRKELKKRQDSIEQFTKGGRADLAEREKLEATILQEYLPQPLTPAELEALVRDSVAETGATSKAQMGAVMKVAMAKAAGRADGKALSAAVSAALP